MKPAYLEFCGVNSFSERAEVDFEKLLEFGIFGIFGDTGSGKSTILDCIVFALYGKVTRFDTKDAVISNLINYHSDRAFVNFEFEIEYGGKRRRYRVERELKRKNSLQNARVFERNGETLSALAEGTRDSNALLEKIIGLEQKDFEKCIALPQGEFAQFVKAQRGERLKLISRLFDLERYGEGMARRIRERYSETGRDAEILKARLEPLESITEAGIAELKKLVKSFSEQEKRTEELLTGVRTEEKNIARLTEQRKEFERAEKEMEKLESEKEAMSQLNDELSRLEKAFSALAAVRDEQSARQRVVTAQTEYSAALAAYERAKAVSEEAIALNPDRIAQEITELTEKAARLKSAEKEAETVREYTRKLAEIEKEYVEESALFQNFSYENERKKLEEKLSLLGDGNFLSYAEEHGKAGLLRGEYAEFVNDLSLLTEKHPIIAPDSDPLILKYRKLSEGGATDFSRLREEFDRLEKEREAVRGELGQLEKAKLRYDAHILHLNRLQTERKEWKARLESYAVPDVPHEISLAEAEKQLAARKEEQTKNTALRERAAKASAEANAALAAARERKKGAEERLAETSARLQEVLEAGGFSHKQEAEALTAKYGNPAIAREKVEKYREDYAAAKRRLRELSQTDYSAAADGALIAVRRKLEETESLLKELAREGAIKREELARAERDILKKKQLTAEFTEKRREAELYERLKKLLEGNKFMEFVAEEYLQTVARNASGRLLSLTDGRYFLRYDNGFVVGDNFNGGAARGVFTLSGGETFLVSLSLALALGAEICQRSLRPIEFFFLDEGFGTLDEKLVDTVMDSLEKLKGEHFSIGIISHVEELRHRIERKLSVRKATERHGSIITLE